MKKVIYIAGYGRSGSTLLDVLLANTESAIGTGELTRLFQIAVEGSDCSCGEPLNRCSLWSAVLSRVSDQIEGFSWDHAQALTRGHERLLPYGRKSRGRYRVLWSTVLDAVKKEAGEDTLVDSSKVSRATAGRVQKLEEIVPDFRIIHLTRHPRAVLWSVRRDARRAGKDPRHPLNFARQVRSLGGWILSNSLTHRVTGMMDAPVLQIRYEDLAKEPLKTMERICDHCDIDIGPLRARLAGGHPIHPGHGIRGGRMRRSGPIQGVRYDDEWERRTTPFIRGLTSIAKPLGRRYGYRGQFDQGASS